jgi:radical SAM superfamily enzyme YgiQ (UPF0313 family)
MRILFTNPPWWDTVRRDGSIAGVRAGSRWPHTVGTPSTPERYVFGGYLPYPFFMGYAATYARKHVPGSTVVLRDSLATRESYESYLRFIKSTHFDYIVMETATASWEHDAQVVALIRRLQPEAKVVLTGLVAGMDAQELMARHGIHAVVKGEYEKGCVKVFEGATGVLEHDLLTKEEMNAAPFPEWTDEIWWRYFDSNPRGQRMPHAQVWTSRGCPFKCIFCVWPAAMTGNDPDGTGVRTVRQYSPEYMEAYLLWLTRRWPFQSIYLDDDTFNLGNGHVLRMCEVMRKVGLPWSAMCRADTIQLDTWKVMKESGCFGVKLGFESGNQYVVDQIVNKHLDLEQGAEVVRHLKKLGMTVHGTFTSGLPGETKEQMADTVRFIRSLPFDSFQHSGTAEIDGTPLQRLREKGSLAKYAGARIDESYNRHADGSKKFQLLARELAESHA